MNEIKNSHILIIGSGSTLKTYYMDIKKYIEKYKPITIGCNNITDFIIPDYHVWTDKYRYLQFGDKINKKSKLIFGCHLEQKYIKRYWSGEYSIINYTMKSRKSGYGIKYNFKKDKYFGYFRTVGSLLILWGYIKKANKISVVGMDGYTFFDKNKLISKKQSQHCYACGYSDKIGIMNKVKKYDNNIFYDFCTTKDKDIYNTLISIYKYGAKFEIITPTVYKKFYNSNVLNIKET